jgi:hypothetical protein
MPNFKPKPKKKFKMCKKKTTTLDSKHHEKMREFDYLEKKTIPELRKKKKALSLKKKNSQNIEEKKILEDKIKEITNNISKRHNLKKEYLLDNSKYIFDYFERKQKISEGNSKKKILHSFFNKKEKATVKRKENMNDIQRYLESVDDRYLNIENYVLNHEMCIKCGGELVPVPNEGILVCKICSKQMPYLIEHEKPSYKEPPKEVCFYAYKRINHFREILAQFQAKETTQIPPIVLTNIKAQIKKERIELVEMTNKRAKDILKKLGYNKYYEHIPFIKDKLGIKPPVMSQKLEDILCNLFMEIQRPYATHCPDDRVNFLNYYYVLYKMCELLGEKKFLFFFPMLKDPVKRIEQDEIWKKICADLNWEFIPTI